MSMTSFHGESCKKQQSRSSFKLWEGLDCKQWSFYMSQEALVGVFKKQIEKQSVQSENTFQSLTSVRYYIKGILNYLLVSFHSSR